MESLPPGDRPPRSRWEEAVEEDVTTGAKATDWGLNNWRTRGESPNPPNSPCVALKQMAMQLKLVKMLAFSYSILLCVCGGAFS